MAKNSVFIFDNYEIDRASREIRLYYKLIIGKEEIPLMEKYVFPKALRWGNTSSVPFHNAVKLLHILAGISYWKAYCPKIIRFATYDITKDEADFFKKVYENGLGEFFYKNKINLKNLVNFPADYKAKIANPPRVAAKERSLLLFGGGKDSLVSAELLKAASKKFTYLSLVSGDSEALQKFLPKGSIVVRRSLDTKLFNLNKRGAYNGHVPISAIIAAVGNVAALLYSYKYIISSNERSANYGNVRYLGRVINHQWSKSLEFEKYLQEYGERFITPSIKYFSLLRPLYEIKITGIFSQFPKYFHHFTSCNANFKILNSKVKFEWCGKCPKCAFVFTMLAAFLPKKELINIFGTNLFADASLLNLFKELLGIRKFKPFECVGTPDEMIYAMNKAHQVGDYENDAIMRMFIREFGKKTINYGRLEKELFSNSKSQLTPKGFRGLIESVSEHFKPYPVK